MQRRRVGSSFRRVLLSWNRVRPVIHVVSMRSLQEVSSYSGSLFILQKSLHTPGVAIKYRENLGQKAHLIHFPCRGLKP
jgi:hypothetical protein